MDSVAETGRFLSEDTYRGETDDADSWHLYAYCANNPINYTDPSGHMMTVAGVAGIVGTTIARIAATIPVKQIIVALAGTVLCQAASKIGNDLVAKVKKVVITKAINNVQVAAEAIKDVVAFAKALQKSFTNRYVVHHIVAKAARKAKPANVLLSKYINVRKDKRNLVRISQRLHAGMHTDVYYQGVNFYMLYGGKRKRSAVLYRLSQLKKAIKATDNLLNSVN